MKNTKEKNGITLISLIITIIVMLILAVIAVAYVNGDGIIGKAKEAKISYQNAAKSENNLLNDDFNSYLQQGGIISNSVTEITSIPVTGISLNKTETTINNESTETLIATIEPSNASNQNLIWTSDNETVATVSNGDVTAVAESGTAVITVTTEDGNFSATCTVTADRKVCFAKGTKITIENGLTQNIEDIKLGDRVLTFNHETGEYELEEVYFTWTGEQPDNIFTLYFENGKSISIAGEHDLFEKENLKYVTITEEDAENFIGKHFYSVEDAKYVELISVTKEPQKVEYYSIYTKNNINCIANGMLSAPDDVDGFLNIYQFNDDLSINHKQLDLDIEKYGIFKYDTDIQYSQEEYDFMNIRYLNIILGKGLITWEEICGNKEEYLDNK